METKGNYVLIGAFTLAGVVGILGFLMWFARVNLDQSYAYYDVKFSSVSGLSNASDVRFAGLPVGQVVSVKLSPDRDGTIVVRLEVDSETPVRADSEATIESQGVTGVAYVGISAGDPSSELLDGVNDIPTIPAGRSILQSLSEDAPELVETALDTMKELNALLSAENRQRVDNILINVEEASESFSTVLDSFSSVTDQISGFADQIDRFNTTLEGLSEDLSVVLKTADTTLVTVNDLAKDGQTLIQTGQGTLTAATESIDSATGYLSNDLPALTIELQGAIADLRREMLVVVEEARTTMATFDSAGSAALARFDEAGPLIGETRALIASLETATAEIEEAATNFDDLMMIDGAALIDESRVAIASVQTAVDEINKVAQTDLPAIVADIREATATASGVVQSVGENLNAASGDVAALTDDAQAALEMVTETFSNANDTLTEVNVALEVGQRTLVAAEKTFEGADRVLNEDIGQITADLREAINTFNAAVADVSADLPEVTEDLRGAARSAEATFVELQTIARRAGTPIATFAADGLPQYTALADETRRLIRNLEKLTKQISRDPARFLLDRDTPEFRR